MEENQTNTMTSPAPMPEVNNSENSMPMAASAATPMPSSGKNPRMASFLERFAAILIDGFLLGLVTWPINIGISFGSALHHSGSANYSGGLIGLVLQFLYFGYFYTTQGQSLGKKVMKIKVVKAANLNYLTWGDVAIRDILGKLLSGLVFGLGYFWYFNSPKRQTWHDSIAHTYVVKTDDHGNLLMDGPDSYKKEPIKIVGLCAAIALVYIAIFVLIGSVIYALTQSFNKMPNDTMQTEMQRQLKEQMKDQMEQLPENDMPDNSGPNGMMPTNDGTNDLPTGPDGNDAFPEPTVNRY